jgi:SAM-dependent methyltransferase
MTAAVSPHRSKTALATPRDDPRLDRVFSIDLALLGLGESTAGARLLDVGCGAGRHELAAAKLPIATSACDIEAKELRLGRFFVGEGDGDAQRVGWVQGTGICLPFRDDAFDAAICSETLEHVPNDVGVLRELRRVMQEGGTLAVSVPATRVESWMWKLSWEVSHTPGGHIRIYERGELLTKLRAAGWQPYAIRHRHAFESVYWLLGAVFGGGNPPPAPARMWRKLITSRRIGPSRWFDRAERLFARPFGKSIVIYARAA